MFKDKELEKRVSEIEEKIEERTSNMNDFVKESEERLSKIEEQLKPKPAFEKGDLVNFFLIGEKLEGEIVGEESDFKGFNVRGIPEFKQSGRWSVKYFDNNNVVQRVTIPEEDIWIDEDDCIDCLHSRIDELETRLNNIETKKK